MNMLKKCLNRFIASGYRILPLAVLALLACLVLTRGIPIRAQITVQESNPEGIIPMNEDPNQPGISEAERTERQKKIIQKRVEMRTKMIEQKRKAMIDQMQKAQAGAVVTPAGPPPPPPPEVQAKAKAEVKKKTNSYVTIYLAPGSINVHPGEKFATICALENEGGQPVDAIDIELTYPRYNIKLLAIHQDKLAPLLAGAPECQVDPEKGTIVYRAKLNRAITSIDIPLMTFEWKAVTAIDDAEIRPMIGEQVSLAMSGKKVLSEGMTGQDSAILGTLIRIISPLKATSEGDRYLDLGNNQLMMAGFKDQRKLQPPHLWIHQPVGETLKPGRWLVIDVGVDNPDNAVFDEVRLAAQFDPEAVEVIDSDRGNWISQGVNLLDGPFHKDWPWDNLYKNEVDTKHGSFYYRMGMNDLREQPSGPFARLFVRIRKEVQSPIFTWVWNDSKDPMEPSTGVYLFNRNIYQRLLTAGGADDSPIAQKMPAYDLPRGAEKADPTLYRAKQPEDEAAALETPVPQDQAPIEKSPKGPAVTPE